MPQQDNWVNGMLSYPPDEVSKASVIMAAQQVGLRLGLKKFSIDFINRNIAILPLVDIKLQQIIIGIISRFSLINQEIDQYNFYFKKTFDSESCNINHEILNTNINSSSNSICKELIKMVDKIINLLLLINEVKCNTLASKLRNIINKLSDIIKKRRQ